MLGRVRERIKGYGWKKVGVIFVGSFVAFIVVVVTVTFYLLFFMERFDNRYIGSEETREHILGYEEKQGNYIGEEMAQY
ncbi:hypothetical protein LGQ02_03620 [Bacillus shivajii]|uniref:hypothetical protein n=1 Tax=Bacillus shivajii TaxID=1983719 RepID=UPI001CF9387F|nr:hypothetical protein [Bacillus shivajii]UCZ53884.1 hypothetical protein LGQ02_03620 [Bacillus shivajii]